MSVPFIHSISQIRDKARVLYEKTEYLHIRQLHTMDEDTIQYLIDDIRALAGDIYNDKLDNTK